MAGRDRKSAEKRKRNMLIFVFIVSLTMILSGFYYTGSQDRTKSSDQKSEAPLLNQYKVQQIGNSSVLVEIKNRTNDVIVTFAPGKVITTEMIKLFLNLSSASLPGLNYVSCDATDKYLLCTVNIKTKNFSALNEKLTDIFSGYYLKRAFIAELKQPYSTIFGINETYIVGNFNNAEDTYVKAGLYQKDYGGFIGFEEKRLPLIDRVPATVSNISNYVISGVIDNDFSLGNFSTELNLNSSEVDFTSPKILINEVVENRTVVEMNALSGVSASTEENKTVILFNQSLAKIKEILLRENKTYELENGSIHFSASLDSNVAEIKTAMLKHGIKDVTVEKQGIVAFTDEVISQGKIVRIENSNNFTAIFKEKTKLEDKVNISLSVIFFGKQIIPIGASEV